MISDYQVTLKAREELIRKEYCFGTRTFHDGDVTIELYTNLSQAIIQVGKQYKIESTKNKTLLDMVAIAIEMKKLTKQEE